MGTNNFAGFMSELGNILPKERIYTDELRTLGWGTEIGRASCRERV